MKTQKARTARYCFGDWLATALEFQLAADILATTVDPDLDSLIKLGIIAVIRTFLNYFLAKRNTSHRRMNLIVSNLGKNLHIELCRFIEYDLSLCRAYNKILSIRRRGWRLPTIIGHQP